MTRKEIEDNEQMEYLKKWKADKENKKRFKRCMFCDILKEIKEKINNGRR